MPRASMARAAGRCFATSCFRNCARSIHRRDGLRGGRAAQLRLRDDHDAGRAVRQLDRARVLHVRADVPEPALRLRAAIAHRAARADERHHRRPVVARSVRGKRRHERRTVARQALPRSAARVFPAPVAPARVRALGYRAAVSLPRGLAAAAGRRRAHVDSLRRRLNRGNFWGWPSEFRPLENYAAVLAGSHMAHSSEQLPDHRCPPLRRPSLLASMAGFALAKHAAFRGNRRC